MPMGYALESALRHPSHLEGRHGWEIVGQIVDPVGTFYRFGLAGSLLGRRLK